MNILNTTILSFLLALIFAGCTDIHNCKYTNYTVEVNGQPAKILYNEITQKYDVCIVAESKATKEQRRTCTVLPDLLPFEMCKTYTCDECKKTKKECTAHNF